jgi:hypothetical protein
MNPTTAENELRAMIGDLFMQVAMLRAENANQRMALEKLTPDAKPNGRGVDPHPEQPGA